MTSMAKNSFIFLELPPLCAFVLLKKVSPPVNMKCEPRTNREETNVGPANRRTGGLTNMQLTITYPGMSNIFFSRYNDKWAIPEWGPDTLSVACQVTLAANAPPEASGTERWSPFHSRHLRPVSSLQTVTNDPFCADSSV